MVTSGVISECGMICQAWNPIIPAVLYRYTGGGVRNNMGKLTVTKWVSPSLCNCSKTCTHEIIFYIHGISQTFREPNKELNRYR